MKILAWCFRAIAVAMLLLLALTVCVAIECRDALSRKTWKRASP